MRNPKYFQYEVPNQPTGNMYKINHKGDRTQKRNR
jgi:hypothetical protein